MIFVKTTAKGNDFIHIEKKKLKERKISPLVQKICHRNNGAGADGVVIYSNEKGKIEFRIFNKDGKEAEISGNGMSGLSAVLFKRYPNKKKINLLTSCGEKEINLLERVDKNRFKLKVEINTANYNDYINFPFLKNNPNNKHKYSHLDIIFVSVGNPHAVIIKEKKKNQDFMEIINKIYEDSIFPNGINIELVTVKSLKEPVKEVEALFYERGVGFTQSSSTGSAAVFGGLNKLSLIAGNSLKIHINNGEEIKVCNHKNIISIENEIKILYKGDYYG